MRLFVLIAPVALFVASCGERELSIEVTQTRPITLFDKKFPGNLRDHPPLSWRRIPPTQFRSVNFVAGEEERVEIFGGNSQGGALTNANRWLGQFGLSPVASEDTFGKIEILGRPSLLVEASGTYNSGMGAPPIKGYALVGAIRESSDGDVLTYKMIGPAEEVAKLRDGFMEYCRSLEQIDVHFIDSENSEEPKP